MNLKSCLSGALALAAAVAMAAEFPSADALKKQITHKHPRLYLTPKSVPAFKVYANRPAQKFYLDEVRKAIAGTPEKPRLAPNPKTARVENGKFVIPKYVGNQSLIWDYLDQPSHYGRNACRAAILYLATGDRKYFTLAQNYLAAYPELIEFTKGQKMMIEWYHTDRLSALVAYDWLYNELDPQIRKKFMSAMVDYSLFITNRPGYITNGGKGWSCGNYGEYGLLWPLAVCAMHDPDADQAKVAKVYNMAYDNELETLRYREKISAGSGLLTSPCTGYCFGYYPYSTFDFLHILKSATGIDGTVYFPQMRDYAKYFDWMAIPGTGVKGLPWLMDFAWGDSYHADNSMPLWLMYTHLAQMIHFFGKSDPKLASEVYLVMNKLPASQKLIMNRPSYPFLPFLLTNFDPSAKGVAAEPDKRLAMFFPSYGLLNIRSGLTAQDTYISIKAGAQYEGHQHFDELAFVIYKDGFLSASTGSRDGAPHHQAYYAQSIAHNCPLIRMADEPLPRHWYPVNLPKYDWNSLRCDGGQNRKRAAKNLGVEQSAYHVVTAGDATQCYSGLKCREAVRQYVFVKPDHLIVYDRLTSVKPDQQKVFVLHTQNEPVCKNGIWTNTEFHGKLFTKTVLPEKVKTAVIGGPGKEFWTNNQNFPVGDKKNWDKVWKRRNFLGRYRIEISPEADGCTARMLHVMQVSLMPEKAMVPVEKIVEKEFDGVKFTTKEGCTARMLHVMQVSLMPEKAMVPVEKIVEKEFDGVKFTTKEGVTATVKFRRDGLIGGSIRLEKNGKVLLDQPLLKPAAVMPPQARHAVPVKPENTARIDNTLPGGKLEMADKGTTLRFSTPRWAPAGTGAKNVEFAGSAQWTDGHYTLKALSDGKVNVHLMGPDVRKNGKRIPVWFEYASCKVNGKEYLKKPALVWHDRGRFVPVKVKTGDVLKIEVKFRTSKGPGK